MRDSDGDGVRDGDDAFPLDVRRQKELRVLRYVPVDVSTSSDAGQNDVNSVAIDGNGQIGFCWEDVPGDAYKTAVWTPASGSALRLTVQRKGPVHTESFELEDENPDDDTPPWKFLINYRNH